MQTGYRHAIAGTDKPVFGARESRSDSLVMPDKGESSDARDS